MIGWRLWLAGLALAAGMGGAVAEPVTYSCSPGVANGTEMGAADTLILDREVPSFELAVAASLGTDAPLNWLFTTRPDEGLGPDAIVMDVVFDTLVGGGYRSSTSYSFMLEMADFRLITMSTYGVEEFFWTCTPP